MRAGLCVVWVGGAIECWGRGLQLQLYSTCSGKGGHVLVETGTFKIALILHIIHDIHVVYIRVFVEEVFWGTCFHIHLYAHRKRNIFIYLLPDFQCVSWHSRLQ